MVNGTTSTSGIDTQMDNSDTTFCILRRNEIFSLVPVSYTHLDVYKRQVDGISGKARNRFSDDQVDFSGSAVSEHLV